MMGKTHIVGGQLFVLLGVPATATVIGLDVSPAELLLYTIVLAPIGALLPDIDAPGSLLSKGWIPMRRQFGWLGYILGWLLCIPARLVGATARLGVQHRGATHTPIFLLGWTIGALPVYMLFFSVIAFVLSIVTAIFGFAFDPSSVWNWQREHFFSLLPTVMTIVFWSYLSHLVLDSMTPSGVPWLWPRKQKYRDDRGRWHTRSRGYNLGWPKPLQAVTGSPKETPYRLAFQICVIVALLLTVALPVARRLDAGIDLPSALTLSQDEIDAGEAGPLG